jgi:fumarylacetoacetate (FAA) hydrolase
MKLATHTAGGRDGTLIVVSPDGERFLPAGGEFPTLQIALERWGVAEEKLQLIHADLLSGAGERLAITSLAAPLPRAWQWLDGSAYRSHGELMERLFGTEPPPRDVPLMYQGMSHQFLSGIEDVPLPSEDHGIDFEGEFGVITDEVPMAVSAAEAMKHIRLIVQINDWSLRTLAGPEMRTGFGWVRAKPACSVAPFAVTLDELGDAWQNGRVHLNLDVQWNDARFGFVHGAPMAHGFDELIAHAASTRSLCAGTIIGSGTVSNPDYKTAGSSCIAERRAIEMLEEGAARTAFMRFGDRVRMEARTTSGQILFGAIAQRVVALGARSTVHSPGDLRTQRS